MIKLHHHTEGSGSPLVLLHGFTGSGVNWAEHVPVFAKQFQVITVDIVGHGRSPSPSNLEDYKMEQVAADVVAVMRETAAPGKAEAAVSRINLLGYSMGGRLALYIATHYPDLIYTLILESASPGLADASERHARQQRDNALADWIETNGIDAFVNRWEQLPLWNSQQQLTTAKRTQLRQQRLHNNPSGLANSLRGMGTGVQPSLWSNLSTLNTQTLIITGVLDTKFVNIGAKMAAQLPNAHHITTQNAGHTVHLEQPAQFQNTILEFVHNE